MLALHEFQSITIQLSFLHVTYYVGVGTIIEDSDSLYSLDSWKKSAGWEQGERT